MCAITLNGEKLVTKDKTIKFSFKNKKKTINNGNYFIIRTVFKFKFWEEKRNIV